MVGHDDGTVKNRSSTGRLGQNRLRERAGPSVNSMLSVSPTRSRGWYCLILTRPKIGQAKTRPAWTA